MSGQLFNQAFGGIFPSTQYAVIPGLIMSAFYLAVKLPNAERNPPNAKKLKAEYDFIIVGAGSAGAVVANRLSEISEFQILLLEAGGDEEEINEVPGFKLRIKGTKQDWNFTTEPSPKFCLRLKNRTCHYQQGKVLGGSSAVNGMMYVRGNKLDYDGWAASGNYGWSFEEVLPYFKKSEDNRIPIISKDERYHSNNGELTISERSWRPSILNTFLKAGQQLGYTIGDYNGENQTVFGNPQVTIRDGVRCSTNKAFLLPASKRKNLDIAKHSHVTKVLIDPSTNRAYGVRFFRYGEYHEVFARKEVILSAGALNTPKLLMLSGIGPKDHLQELNIPLFRDLPVGFNLQDHVAFEIMILTDQQTTFLEDKYRTLINMTYELYKKGPLTSVSHGVIAFFNSKFQDPKKSHPDLQFSFVPISPAPDGISTKNESTLGEEPFETKQPPNVYKERFFIEMILLHPESRGRVLLRSNNPFDKPVLRMNYFDKEIDAKRLADGGRIALEIIETKALKSINSRFKLEPIPLCPELLSPNEEYFKCFLKYNAYPYIHSVGTAKMGPTNDLTAVVDPELRINGISGLRVVDNSIMPKIVSGNTNAPAIMIGEKGSDLIKDTWIEKKKQVGY